MVPSPSLPKDKKSAHPDEEPLDAIPVLNVAVRGTLLWIAAGLIFVFALALWLEPYEYDETGKIIEVRTSETHRKLGLPPCTFKQMTKSERIPDGIPCPSCGMTTSFSLLMHGDLLNSVRANSVGTILAVVCILMIPWCLACGIWGRTFVFYSIEGVVARLVIIFLFLMLTRWVIVVTVTWLYGGNFKF